MKEIYTALAAFQQEVPVIHKDTQGYGYTYADLPAILEVINPMLKKHGLGFTQTVNDDKLCTTIFHCESGQKLEGCATIPQGVELKGMNSFQVLGSAITYMRRYQLSAMLGLVTDKDTDAGGEQKTAAKPKEDDNKPWLNENTEDWKNAVEFLVNGFIRKDGTHENGSVLLLRKKFKISKANEQKLIEQASST